MPDNIKHAAGNPVFNPRLKYWLALLGLLAVIVVAVLLITDRLYNQQKFNISKITLTGDAAHVDRIGLQQSVASLIKGNYFSLNSEEIIRAVAKLPWVEKVRLRRRWPDTLMIDIEEYQPIALWGEDRWLTTSGKIVSLPLPKNVVLPQLDGPVSAAEQVWETYQKWTKQFAQNGIRLRKMKLSKQHLYTLTLEYTTRLIDSARGFEMILAEQNADQQLTAFLSSRRQSLIEFPGQIKTVDMRYPSGFSISRYEPDKLVRSTSN